MAILAPTPDPATPPLRRVPRSFAAGPVAIPCLLSVIVMIVWAATEAGEAPTDWYPGAIVIVALLVLAASTLPLRFGEVPRPVLVAGGFLLAFTLWNFLSISWADAGGDAWDGANRTLLYLGVFLLFALWPQRGGAASVVISVWILAMAALAAVVLLQTRQTDALDLFAGGRLSEPAGYANATAALFLMPAWPALILAGRPEMGPLLRGVLGGAATLLAGVAAIALSRGSVFSVPIMLLVVFALVPGRARTFAVLLPVGGAVALCLPTILDVSDKLLGDVGADVLSPLAPTVGLAALGAAVVVGIGAWIEGRVTRAESRHRAHRAFSGLGLATLAVVLIVGLIVAGNPFQRLQDGWDSFKQGYPEAQGQRLAQGLGSNRYDFYRVALDVFRDHPVAGVGSDNFQQDYLAARRSGETPRYPHSVELRTLSQTGVVGTLLLLGFLAAAFAGVLRAARRAPPLAAAAAGAAATVFIYWLIHGSFDWLWEFAGLGVPAFAMIGMACGLHPRSQLTRISEDGAWGREAGGLPRVAIIAASVLGVLSFALPWLSDVQVDYAAGHWTAGPAAAYDRLDRAASLDRLSPDPYLVEGTIALRRSEEGRARTSFAKALERDPRSAYATLELGALATLYGDWGQAQRLLDRAVSLDPRDSLKRSALQKARERKPIEIDQLNAAIRDRAEKLR